MPGEERCMHLRCPKRPNLLQGAAVLTLQLLLLLAAAPPEASAARQLLAAPCSIAASPVIKLDADSVWTAELGRDDKASVVDIAGLPVLPLPQLVKPQGTFELKVNEDSKLAAWTLKLCDVPFYTASHLHLADHAPPLIPLEPFTKPADPLGPPELLPQLCPNVNIIGCSYTKEGSFFEGDIIALPGRDGAKPAVASWEDFLQALHDGKIYVNVHSLNAPAGLIRGYLHPAPKEDHHKEKHPKEEDEDKEDEVCTVDV